MKYSIVYWSRFGNGKKIAEYLEQKLSEQNHEVLVYKTDEVDPSSLPESDTYVFSAPTEAFRVQKNMRSFIKKIQGVDGKKYGIINTHGMKRNWLSSMEKMLTKKNMEKAAAIDFQIGEGQNQGNGLQEGWQTKLDDFIEKIQ